MRYINECPSSDRWSPFIGMFMNLLHTILPFNNVRNLFHTSPPSLIFRPPFLWWKQAPSTLILQSPCFLIFHFWTSRNMPWSSLTSACFLTKWFLLSLAISHYQSSPQPCLKSLIIFSSCFLILHVSHPYRNTLQTIA